MSSETSNHTATDSQATTNESAQVTPEEIAEVMEGLKQYRERLVTDMTNVAKKAKLKKSEMMAKLEPELADIDKKLEHLEHLRSQYPIMAHK